MLKMNNLYPFFQIGIFLLKWDQDKEKINPDLLQPLLQNQGKTLAQGLVLNLKNKSKVHPWSPLVTEALKPNPIRKRNPNRLMIIKMMTEKDTPASCNITKIKIVLTSNKIMYRPRSKSKTVLKGRVLPNRNTYKRKLSITLPFYKTK